MQADKPAGRPPPWVIPAYVVLGCLLAAGCLYAALCCASSGDFVGQVHGSDDAYISFRYARNFVDGQGLVFNPGDRVEGYSNLLYVLLMTLPFRLGLDVMHFSLAFNTACTVAALAIFAHHMRSRVDEKSAFAASLLLVCCTSLWIWAASGLETSLVLLLQVSVWILVDRGEDGEDRVRDALLAVTVAALVVTRADGFVTAFITLVYLLIKGRMRTGAAVAATLAIALGALLAWRFSYYHELWPNTYYAKVSGGPLLHRVRGALGELSRIVASQGLVVCLVAIPFGLALSMIESWRRGSLSVRDVIRFDLFFALSWLAYWIDVGGDVYEERFLIILIPLGLSVLFRTILRTADERVGAFAVALGLVVELSVLASNGRYRSKIAHYDLWITLGQFLRLHRSGQVLAVDAAGKVPFFSGLRTIDLLGLNDRHIAHLETTGGIVGHSKQDPDYVLSLRPDLIACWFDFKDDNNQLDLKYGMSRRKYEAAGYRVSLVVNSNEMSRPGEDILDVQGRSDAEIATLMRGAYAYAVLERR